MNDNTGILNAVPSRRCIFLGNVMKVKAVLEAHQEFPPESVIKKQTKLDSFPQHFNHIFLLMSRKYVNVVNEKYVLDQ